MIMRLQRGVTRRGVPIVLALLLAGVGVWAAAQPTNALAIVQAARRHYPTPMTAADHVTFLTEVARTVGGGLLRKPGGENCLGYACDIICFADLDQYDVLGDSDGAAVPSWNHVATPSAQQGCQKVAPTPEPPPGPPPPPDTPPVSPDLPPALIAQFDRVIAACQAAQGPPPTYEATVSLGWLGTFHLTLVPK